MGVKPFSWVLVSIVIQFTYCYWSWKDSCSEEKEIVEMVTPSHQHDLYSGVSHRGFPPKDALQLAEGEWVNEGREVPFLVIVCT